MAERFAKIRGLGRDFLDGVKADYVLGREDRQKMFYTERELAGGADDAPIGESMRGTHPLAYRIQEATGSISPAKAEALRQHGMNLRGSTAHKVGQFVGSAGADLTQDISRGIYWLLNAPQATAQVINDSVLRNAAPSLYETSPVNHPTRMVKTSGGKVPRTLKIGDKEDLEYMLKNNMVMPNDGGGYKPGRGYKFKEGDEGKELYKRNYEQGMLAATAIPTGIAINTGLGLLTPFGGAEGYKAALPSDEDPTKTDNVLGEIALKYVMGRTGNLLPYDEFRKVRPDVSREEYNKYQAFKYDRNEDWNPTDGDVTLLNGLIKATTEGVHGPELQFLGRGLPVTTGIIPFLSSLAGGAAGARMGAAKGRAAMGGVGGGMAGLIAGQVTGNIIEQERRRRNSVENQMEGGSAETYLS